MALRKFRGKRSRILLCGAIHPEYLAVAETYAQTPDKGLQALAPGGDGRADLAALRAALGPDVAAVVVQHPNFYGLLEDLAAIRALTAEHEALLIVTFTEPMAFGMLKPPGEFGADIVVGEGQSFGLPTGFGGPLLGLMATRKEHVRLMPGRLVGRTKDRNGNDAFVITLATREQHIRREKATSNICTNEGLCALACAIYLSLLGNEGLAKLAALNHHVSCTLKAMLGQVPGVRFPFSGGAHFNELVVELPGPAAQVVEKMADQGIVAGVPLSRWYPDQPTRLLVAATELNDAAGLKAYVEALASLV
jgi:glycine dehydrogenase subunit 1